MNELLLQSAVRAHQAGNFAEAARLYGEILRANPRHFQALYRSVFSIIRPAVSRRRTESSAMHSGSIRARPTRSSPADVRCSG
jgi:hypothetical protein